MPYLSSKKSLSPILRRDIFNVMAIRDDFFFVGGYCGIEDALGRRAGPIKTYIDLNDKHATQKDSVETL